MHDVSDRILNRIGGRKTYLAACSQLPKRLCGLIMQSLSCQKPRVRDVKCNYDILYAVGPAHVTRNVAQNTRPSFHFLGGSGDKTSLLTLVSSLVLHLVMILVILIMALALNHKGHLAPCQELSVMKMQMF